MIDILPITFVDFSFTLHLTTSVIAQGAVVLLLFGTLILPVLFFIVASHESPMKQRPKPLRNPP